MPNVRACDVFIDTEAMTHSVRVNAASLFEAAALGLAEFKRCALMDAAPCPATRLTVVVESPGSARESPTRKLTAWGEEPDRAGRCSK